MTRDTAGNSRFLCFIVLRRPHIEISVSTSCTDHCPCLEAKPNRWHRKAHPSPTLLLWIRIWHWAPCLNQTSNSRSTFMDIDYRKTNYVLKRIFTGPQDHWMRVWRTLTSTFQETDKFSFENVNSDATGKLLQAYLGTTESSECANSSEIDIPVSRSGTNSTQSNDD